MKNELSLAVTLYEHTEQGSKKLAQVQPKETFSLPVSIYVEKTPLRIGLGCVDRAMCTCMLVWEWKCTVEWNMECRDRI